MSPVRHRAGHSRRICYLHVGTHKTGTTALQSTLAIRATSLRLAGLHVPQAGRRLGQAGHHNIAWELNHDERFDPSFGTLDDLLTEVAAVRAPAICLSSEDFEYLHVVPQTLMHVRDAFDKIGYEIVVVLYLRPQASYAESLYCELLKHGFARTFDDYLVDLVRDGYVTFGSRWRFTFDYETLVSDFAAVFGAQRVVVRPYIGDVAHGLIARDFLRIPAVHLPSIKWRNVRTRERLNASASFAEVVLAYASNARARSPGAMPVPVAHRRLHGNRFDPVRLPEVARLTRRFAAGNQRIGERYGVTIPCVSRLDLLADVAAALGFDAASHARRDLLRAQYGPSSLAHEHAKHNGTTGELDSLTISTPGIRDVKLP